jgi:hypothetical protein
MSRRHRARRHLIRRNMEQPPRQSVTEWAERARERLSPPTPGERFAALLAGPPLRDPPPQLRALSSPLLPYFAREVLPEDLFPPMAFSPRYLALDAAGPHSVYVSNDGGPPRLLGQVTGPVVFSSAGYDVTPAGVEYTTMRWDELGRGEVRASGNVTWDEAADPLADIQEAVRQLRARAIAGDPFVPFPGWTLLPDAVDRARAAGIDAARFMDAALGEPWPEGQGSTGLVWDEPRTYSTEDLLDPLRTVREELKPAEDEPAAIVVLGAGGHAVVTLLPKATEESVALLFGEGQAHQVEEFRRMHPGRALLVLGSDAYRKWMKTIPTVDGDARTLHSFGLPVYHTRQE